MKKVLVFMLILAVTAGVFAQETITIQGETVTEVTTYTVVRSTETIVDPYTYTEVRGVWSVGANAKFSTSVYLNDAANIAFGPFYGQDNEGAEGNFSLGYKKELGLGTLNVSIGNLRWRNNWGGAFDFGVEGTGLSDRYKFKFSGALGNSEAEILSPDLLDGSYIGLWRGDLWGWYKMFDGKIQMMVSLWGSPGGIASFGGVVDTDGGHNMTYNPGGHFAVNVDLGALKFGGIIPRVFYNNGPSILLLDAFQQFIFGIEYDAGIFKADAWFRYMPQLITHFGIGTSIGPVDLSLSFDGAFTQPDYTNWQWNQAFSADPWASVGLGISYDGGTFGGGVDFDVDIVPDFAIGIKPSFWVKVMPDNLHVNVETKFVMNLGTTNSVDWELHPEFTWNFLNNGASDFGDVKTGMGIGYLISGSTDGGIDKNWIRFRFKWSL